MPKVAYSDQERARIREALVTTALELMAKQGIQHTTVEQIYKAVGVARTFFYSFFPTKEDLIVETLYLQQPRILAYARKLMADPNLSWQEAVEKFLHDCCYGERNGIAVLTIEEQQLIFRHLVIRHFSRRRATASSGRSRPGCSATFWSALASGPPRRGSSSLPICAWRSWSSAGRCPTPCLSLSRRQPTKLLTFRSRALWRVWKNSGNRTPIPADGGTSRSVRMVWRSLRFRRISF